MNFFEFKRSEVLTDQSDNETRPASKKKKIAQNKQSGLPAAIIDSKLTPDFHTPRSQTSESLLAESYDAAAGHISSSPANADIKLKAMSSKSKKAKSSNKAKPEKKTAQKTKSNNAKPITNESLNKIAARLADENRKKENLINPIEDSAADADDETVASSSERFRSVVNSEISDSTKTKTASDESPNEKN